MSSESAVDPTQATSGPQWESRSREISSGGSDTNSVQLDIVDFTFILLDNADDELFQKLTKNSSEVVKM